MFVAVEETKCQLPVEAVLSKSRRINLNLTPNLTLTNNRPVKLKLKVVYGILYGAVTEVQTVDCR